MKIAVSATNINFDITNDAGEKVVNIGYDNYAAEVDITKLIESGANVVMLLKQLAHSETMQRVKNEIEYAVARAEATRAEATEPSAE